MKTELESALQRWRAADLLNNEQAVLIRDYENRAPAHRANGPAGIGLIAGLAFGGIMCAAGLLLFVSAHWANMSPGERMFTLICAVVGTHLTAAFAMERSPATGITLHAIGTVALGGAVFLTGQIFNMQEHWPDGVFLWALGALAGWLLLRQWPQFAMCAILIPWWLIAEISQLNGNTVHVASVGAALLAVCYMSVPSVRVYLWIGGIALLPAILVVALSAFWNRGAAPALPAEWCAAVALPLLFVYVYRKQGVWINGVAAVWVLGLNLIATQGWHAATYAWCAVGCAGLIAWGIVELRPERVNLGMAGFALTVTCFFFSGVMNKMGRSASLLVLGILFLCGGWYWEKVRRRLVAQSKTAQIQTGGEL